MFEYLRRLEPQPAPPAPTVPVAPTRDETDLDALVARARAHAVDEEEDRSLACASPRHGLPRFSGITLADVVLQPPPHERRASLSITAPLPSQPRVLLGPGAMTMTLAVVATLVFGVVVATY